MSRAEMTSALQTPSIETKTAPRSPWIARWGAFYAVQGFAAEQPIEHGPGLMAAFGQREGRWRLAAWAKGQYQLPQTIDTGIISVRLDTVALRVGAEVARSLTARVALATHIGLGGDIVHIAPRQGSSGHATLSSERFTWEYLAQLALVATVQMDAGVTLSGALIADADLGMRHYDVLLDGSTVRALTPRWIRPGVMAGVTWP
jgi:hypothetical protein